MEYIELTAVVSNYSYKNIADSLKSIIKQNKKVKILEMFLSIGTHNMKDWLVSKFTTTKMSAIMLDKINEKSKKQCVVKDILICKKEDESMEIKLDISDYNYNEIFAFLTKQFAKSKNVYLSEFLPLCLRQFDKTIADEEKNRLFIGILNNLPDSVLSELAGILKKKTGITLKITSLGCKAMEE